MSAGSMGRVDVARNLYVHEIWLDGRCSGAHRLVARGGRWAAVEPADGPDPSDHVLDGLAVPALIDLHGHVGEGIGPFAVDPVEVVSGGVAMVCAQGDAGATNFASWLAATQRPDVSVLLALNLDPQGEAGLPGSLARIDRRDVDALVETANANPLTIRMISVNLGRRALGDGDPAATLAVALDASQRTGLPLLVGLAANEDMTLIDQLDRLRSGDVVTYCYRSSPWCLFPGGRPVRGLESARQRGVLLDVGHGKASFDSEVSAAAIAAGHFPDTISSDLQVATMAATPSVWLPYVMQRLVTAGLPLDRALAATTSSPAAVLGVENRAVTFELGAPVGLTMLDRSDRWTARVVAFGGHFL